MKVYLELEFQPGEKSADAHLRKVKRYKHVTLATLEEHEEKHKGWRMMRITIEAENEALVRSTVQRIRDYFRKHAQLGSSSWKQDGVTNL